MAVAPWDYSATNGVDRMPAGFSDMFFFIGLGSKADIEGEAFRVYIDMKIEPFESSEREHIIGEWQDILRLPTSGSQSRDHPLIVASRNYTCVWIGNVKLFPSIYELMRAVSYYSHGWNFMLMNDAGTIVERSTGYHPMCGKMPIKFTPNQIPLLKTIFLQIAWYAREFKRSGHLDQEVHIYRNLYSVYSSHMTAIIYAISYFKLFMNGDGTVLDKLIFFAEYRRELAIRITDVYDAISAELGTTNYADYAVAVDKYFTK